MNNTKYLGRKLVDEIKKTSFPQVNKNPNQIQPTTEMKRDYY